MRPSTWVPWTPLALSLALSACTTVQVTERDVFDPNPSVSPERFSHPVATLEEVFIGSAAPEVELSAWWLERDDARTTILFFGSQSFHLVHSAGYLRTFADLPVNALLVDYRGYGRSGGEPSVAALRADALAIYDHLVDERGVDPSRLIVHGHAVGSFLALNLAAGRTVGAAVLENPATNAQDWTRTLAPWYVRLFVRIEVEDALGTENNLTRIDQVDAPVLILAGEHDRVAPPAMARRLHDAAPEGRSELVVMEDGGHNNLYRFPPYRAAYERLLERIGGGTSR